MGWEMKLERCAEPRSRRGLCERAKQGDFNPGLWEAWWGGHQRAFSRQVKN